MSILRTAPNAKAQLSLVEHILVGLLAGTAICIKPQSIFAPLLVELVLILQSRNLKSFVSSENLSAVVFAIIYGVSILLFAPKFFTEMLTLGTNTYVPFYGYSLSLILLNASWTIVAFIVAYAIRRRLAFLKADTRFIDGLLAAALGFIISYFVQMKGFGYQMMPADILASFAGTCAAVMLWKDEKKLSPYILGSICIPVILLLGSPQTYLNSFKTFDGILARNAPQAKSLFIASTQIEHGFPYVQQRNFVWASRLPTQWLAPYVDSKWHGGGLPEDAFVQKALDWTVSDLISFKPDIVMIDIATDQFFIKSGKFEFVKFWQNDKRFSAVWNDYKYRETVGGFDIFTLNKPVK